MVRTFMSLFFGLSLSPMWANAATCVEQKRQQLGEAMFEVMDPGGGDCWFMFGPNKDKYVIPAYRDFLLDTNGFVMVFVSYGPGPEDRMLGAREFYTFPRTHEVSITTNAAGVNVTFANGATALYSSVDTRWHDVSGVVISEQPDLKMGDQGGWEMRPLKGVILDFGFRIGGSPSGDQKGRARFIDAKGQVCEVDNREVIDWSPTLDPILRFGSDDGVQDFLRQRCPDISW